MKKNIAIFVPELSGGGAERVASNLLMYLPDEKYNKFLIVYDDKKIVYPYKGKLISLNTGFAATFWGKLMNFFKRIYRLRKVKKEYKIDTTISLLSSTNNINILSKRRDKIVISVRNYLSKSNKGFYGKVYKLLVKLLYNKANIITVVSKLIKKDLIENFNVEERKIKVIYNLYDIEKINKLARKEIEYKNKTIFKNPTVITVGRLSKQKGQWHLIRAFKKVKNQIQDVKLVILGEGEVYSYLKQLTVDLEIEEDVFFLGFQENPFKYIANSTVYVFPSLYEGFPNALCEAMACSIPVISADCKSGPREILAPGTDINIAVKDISIEGYGILVPVCDGVMYKYEDKLTKEEEILSKSMIKMLSDQDLIDKYSSKAINRVKSFNKENIIKMWEEEI